MVRAARKSLFKVVAHLRDHKLIKGFTDAVPASNLEALVEQEPVALPRIIAVRPAKSRQKVSFPLASLKALFFVKSFEGHREYNEIKFFGNHPQVEGLWVRLKFYDNEFTEGVVRNSLDLLTNPGFFLKPPDPESNNEIIYVVKASLIEFQVLGVKTTY